MGAIISSKADINPVLATQTPQNLSVVPNVSASTSPSLVPLNVTLTIPQLQRPVEPKDPLPQAPKQSVTSDSAAPLQLIQKSHSLSNLDQSVEHPFNRTDSSLQTPMHMQNPRLNDDATVIFRSVLNLDDHRRWNRYPLSRTRPRPTIVEHRGKQFLSEYRERIERRYVQVFDESVGRMRFFEVTDYIPSQTVRPMRQSNQRRTNSVMPSTRPAANRVNFQHAGGRETFSQPSRPYRDQTPEWNPVQSNPIPLAAPVEKPYNHPQATQSNAYESSLAPHQAVNDPYIPGSYHSQVSSIRAPIPTASSHSSLASTVHSDGLGSVSDPDSDDISDGASSDRYSSIAPDDTVRAGSYALTPGSPSGRMIDPFAKKPPVKQQTYVQQGVGRNNYTEPMSINRPFATTTGSDYTPIRAINQQLNRDKSSVRRPSNSSAYNG